jgi:hypothetical protein
MTRASTHVRSRQVFYLCPDHPEPSWGIGMLYTHVAILRRNGVQAWVLHHSSPFRPPWFASEAPVAYLDRPTVLPGGDDLLVVPDVLAASEAAGALAGQRVVFVQGPFTILPGLRGARDYRSLGYQAAMAVLPSVGEIVERYFGVTASLVPPCIAPEFFADPRELDRKSRERRVLLTVPKVASPDFEVLVDLLARQLGEMPQWAVVDLKGFSHDEVARLMKESAFLVNTNLGEAFNTTVPEAMAAGCIVLCYEAYGGRDFLHDGQNAYVFPNHYVFPLLERLVDLMVGFEAKQGELARMRSCAFDAATSFTEEGTEHALLAFMASRIS